MQNQIICPGVPYSGQICPGVTFNGKNGWTNGTPGLGGFHTWDDWQAYWTDIVIDPPETEIFTVNIPGRHGLLDLSETLTGSPVYKNRNITITLKYPGSGSQWHEEYSQILAQLHGRMIQMILDSDPEYYYEGRCTVSSQRPDNFHSVFTISMDAYPYKYQVADSSGDWLWDPLNFETGVIREFGNLSIPANGTLEIILPGSDLPVRPRIIVNHACTVKIQGKNYSLESGVNLNLFTLEQESLALIFENPKEQAISLSIQYRGGKL
ncbi:MAG: hypothetical protein K2G25_07265 [Oscillospiraceae bacterium]|nr:hypothetical protein [Oscillospiraceae bacterium]